MSVYEFGVFGSVSLAEREILARTIESMVGDFGLVLGAEVAIHDAASVAGRDKHAAFTAVYFGSPDHAEADVVQDIVRENAPIIPTVGTTGDLSNNDLESLPDGLFSGLPPLAALKLGDNPDTGDTLPLTVTVEKVGTDQARAKVLAGAPTSRPTFPTSCRL